MYRVAVVVREGRGWVGVGERGRVGRGTPGAKAAAVGRVVEAEVVVGKGVRVGMVGRGEVVGAAVGEVVVEGRVVVEGGATGEEGALVAGRGEGGVVWVGGVGMVVAVWGWVGEGLEVSGLD